MSKKDEAFISWHWDDDDNVVLIDKIFVPPESRGQGEGSRLLRAALKEIDEEYPDADVKLAAYQFDEDDPGMELADLVEWYENEGFKIESTEGHAVVMALIK